MPLSAGGGGLLGGFPYYLVGLCRDKVVVGNSCGVFHDEFVPSPHSITTRRVGSPSGHPGGVPVGDFLGSP